MCLIIDSYFLVEIKLGRYNIQKKKKKKKNHMY